MRAEMAAGVTPDMREAWPRDLGHTSWERLGVQIIGREKV